MTSFGEVVADIGKAISAVFSPFTSIFDLKRASNVQYGSSNDFKAYILAHQDFGYYYGFNKPWAFASAPAAVFPPLLTGAAPRPSPYNSGPAPVIFDPAGCADPDFQKFLDAHPPYTEGQDQVWPVSGLIALAGGAVVVGAVASRFF